MHGLHQRETQRIDGLELHLVGTIAHHQKEGGLVREACRVGTRR
jgi:hypothetical protein